MDIFKLIDEIEDLVEDGSSIPFSKKVMVDINDILAITEEIRIRLPDEIKQASWIKEEKEKILKDAKEEADNLLKDAEQRLEQLIDKEGITKAARTRAEDTITKAQNNAKEIQLGSLEYADNILLDTQEELKSIIELINENRKELRGSD